MACQVTVLSYEDGDPPCPRMPMYSGFSIAADGIGFKMPCRWCGETIAESTLDEPIDLENGFGDAQAKVIVSHLEKYHSGLFKDGLTFNQECEKCHNHATFAPY